MDKTLLVLAAGMGSRYGGLKQMDAFGPNGETIIDYSIYDAINAGFNKVVFIIREHFKDDFVKFFTGKFEDKIKVKFVTQELNKIPEGYEYHPEREKPWGTAHAVLMAKDVIHEPFAVINGDDFYGPSAYSTLSNYFDKTTNKFAVVAYYLKNTLSDHGTVNRGVCYGDENGHLSKVVECIKIARNAEGIPQYPNDEGGQNDLSEDALVSMNMWGFTPDFFNYCEAQFKAFLSDRGMELKSEFYIPAVVDNLIQSNEKHTEILDCDAIWFGVTYQEDKPNVIAKLNALIGEGVYPAILWG